MLITWLASYPQSGSALLRVILKECFGLASRSRDDDASLGAVGLQEAVGHEALGGDQRRFAEAIGHDACCNYVKTHQLPGQDTFRAIYVVRDGRAAVLSCWRHLQMSGHAVCLSDIIRGELAPSWSEHVEAWALSNRPDTLAVRYEQLITGDATTFQKIAQFLGHPLLQPANMCFDDLHARHPQIFRRSSDAAKIVEMDAVSLRLFEDLHGATLRRVGYGAMPGGVTRSSPRAEQGGLPR